MAEKNLIRCFATGLIERNFLFVLVFLGAVGQNNPGEKGEEELTL